jgi:hypothetical protein
MIADCFKLKIDFVQVCLYHLDIRKRDAVHGSEGTVYSF